MKFCESNGIIVLKYPCYHPKSNGSGERAVQTIKQCLKKSIIDLKTQHITWEFSFLLKYRNTASTLTIEIPSNIIFKFKPRILLGVMMSKMKEENGEVYKYTSKYCKKIQ